MEIIHLPKQHRFEYRQEELVSYVEYVQTEESLDIEHTYVPRPLEGRGIASSLVQKAYDYALGNRLKPKATCSYAVTWLERHPDYKR